MATEKTAKKLQFSKKNLEELEKILALYQDKQAALLPILHLAQKQFGYVDNEVIAYIADILNLHPSIIKGAASFYTLFSAADMGKYVIRVCQTLSCSLLGSDHLIDYLSKNIGVTPGETTKDKKITLLKCECLGSCGTAPVMMINDEYYENLTEKKIDHILKNLR